MKTSRRQRLLSLTAAAALALGTLSVVGVALTAAPAQADQGVVVSPTPDARAPRVTNGRVYAIDSHGPLVAVGGSFTTIRPGGGGADQSRQWLFMYNSETGVISQTFLPELRGPEPAPTIGYVKDQPGVEAIQFAPDGQSLYVGGWFTSVNGTTRNRIVQLNLDGSVRTSFDATFNNTVSDLALVGDRLVVGGRFGQANGQPASRLLSLDPATGATQADFNLPATESRNQYTPYVNEIDASADGRWLAVSGSFKKIGTAARNQLALIDLQGTPSVANWSTEAYAPNCSQSSTDSGSYIRGLSISPDSSYLVVSTTGAFVGAETTCDTATRWELPPVVAGDNLAWTWRAKTGGDTLWATKVTESAVYVGGHQRWMNNPRPSPGGDNDGPGSVQRPGISALDPLTGVPLSWNPSRDRGRGAEAIHATDDYLFVGHDTDLWGGAIRQRLAQLPVAGGAANPQPTDVQLPVSLYVTDGSTLSRASFDGAALGAPATVSGPGVDSEDWSSNRGGFVQNGKLHYFGASQAFYSRPFSDSTTSTAVGAPTNLSTSVGYVDTNYNLTPNDQPYGVAETTAATYNNGRIYYVKSGDAKLYQRGYSLESGIVEATEYVASSQSFSSARALNFIGDWLYAAWSDGSLYRFHAPDGKVDYATRTLVDGGASIDWEDVRGFWSTQATGTAVEPTPPASAACAAPTPWKATYWANATLTGGASATRCETEINNDWGTGAPAGANVGVDSFSASWTRTVQLSEPGAIRVDATADDGVRAYVDGKLVIDSWIDTAPVPRTGTSGALAAGPHEVRIEYYERSGGAVARATTTVVAPPAPEPEPDNLPGDTTITAPGTDEVLSSTAVTLAGEATDNQSVAQVKVGVYNRNDAVNRWLQADGTWGPGYAARTATLTAAGAASTGWSLAVTLPEGDYAVDARSVDATGNEDPDRAWRQFSVSTTTVDTVAPTLAVTAPTSGQAIGSSSVGVAGTAADDVGVTQVRVAVYNRGGDAGNRWLQADGTWGSAYAFRSATLGSPGATSTGWNLSVSLPDGQYAVDVRALDERRNETDPRAWTPFTVSTAPVDTTKPAATVSSPAKSSTVTTHAFTASGTTTDNAGVDQVRVGIYNRANTAAPWLQANGTWGAAYAFRAATVTSSGALSSGWDLGLNLPDGLYALDVRAVDRAGNASASLWWPFTLNAPSADRSAPTSALAGKQGAVVKGRKVSFAGSARDNTGVRKVLVAIAKPGNGTSRRWLQGNGSWGEVQVFRLARLTEPNRRTTGWKLRLSLPKGAYAVTVLSSDRSANVQRTATTRRFTVNTGG